MEEHPHEELESSQQESLPLPDNNINDGNDLTDNNINDENDSVSNLKHLLQVQLFDQILKPGMDVTIVWNMIDSSKLKVGLERTLQAVQAQAERRGWENLEKIGTGVPQPIKLNGGKTINNFPALQHYGIPMVATAIHSVMHDTVQLSKHSTNVDVLNVPLSTELIVLTTLFQFQHPQTMIGSRKMQIGQNW